MPSPSIEIAVTGVQNRRILSGLLLSLLAAKNKAKNETARIQNSGEKRLSSKPPATAAKPVALELLIPRSAKNSPGPSSPTNTADSALSVPRRIVIGAPRRPLRRIFYSESGAFMDSCCKIAITLIFLDLVATRYKSPQVSRSLLVAGFLLYNHPRRSKPQTCKKKSRGSGIVGEGSLSILWPKHCFDHLADSRSVAICVAR